MHPDKLYNKEFLLGDLYSAATTMNPREYARFHFDSLNKYAKHFESDFLTVNILHLNKKQQLDGNIVSAVVNQPDSIIDNYQRNLAEDNFTPKTFIHSGTALFVEAENTMDYWYDSTIYKKHCTIYDQYWVLGISYPFPHKKTTFLAIDYMRAKGDGFLACLKESYIEYITYPFYLGWLHIHDEAICKETLHDWLTLVTEMTETRFHLLRSMAGHGVTNSKTLSKTFGVTPKTIDKNIANAFDALSVKFHEHSKNKVVIPNRNNDQRSMLVHAYRFMEFGKGDMERILPKR